eukprot:Seg513.8 transcript_id=Seg513.8/GoldUCD/mRNA.D3Y31 product="hypothetical protein" protein_id=Seg513.8/GoldUCD/D3Y31
MEAGFQTLTELPRVLTDSTGLCLGGQSIKGKKRRCLGDDEQFQTTDFALNMNVLAAAQTWNEFGSDQEHKHRSSHQQEKRSGRQNDEISSPGHENASNQHCGQQKNRSKIEHENGKTGKHEIWSSHEKLWPKSNKSLPKNPGTLSRLSFTDMQSKHHTQVLDIERSYVNTGYSEEDEVLDSKVKYENMRAKDLVELSGAHENRSKREQEHRSGTGQENRLHQGQVKAKLDCLQSWHTLSDVARNDQVGIVAVKQQMTSKGSSCAKTSRCLFVRDVGANGHQGEGRQSGDIVGQNNRTQNGRNNDNSRTDIRSEQDTSFVELMLQNLIDTGKYTEFAGNEKRSTKNDMQINHHGNSFQNGCSNADQNDDVYEKMYGHNNPSLLYDWPRTKLKTQILEYFDEAGTTGVALSDTEYLDVCGEFEDTEQGADETMESCIYDVIDEREITRDAARITQDNAQASAARYVCMERNVQRSVTREKRDSQPVHHSMKRKPRESVKRIHDSVARGKDGKRREKHGFARKAHDSAIQDKSPGSGYHLQRYDSYPAIISSQKHRMERNSRCKDGGGQGQAPRLSDSIELKQTEDVYDYESDEDQTTVSWPTLLRKSKHLIAAASLLMLIVICTVTILSLLLWHEHI